MFKKGCLNNSEEGNNGSEIAGKLMVSNVPVINVSLKIKDARDLISKKINDFESISYIYVVDKSNCLKGVLSIKDIFRENPNVEINKVMNKEVVSIRYHTDQEHATILALKHKLKSIPVVDKDNKFLGMILSRTILETLHKESIEDILRSAGISKFKDPAVELINSSSFVHIKKRLPWLLFGLVGGLVAAFVIGFFEGVLERQIVLAAFIPAIVYMADAVGAQSQTIFIRSIALDKKLSIWNYAFRELKVNLVLGAILGAIFLLFIFLWQELFLVGLIIGVSVFASVMISMAISIVLPLAFQKFKFDPAIASGPFATSIRDLTSLIVYFAIANILMNVYV